MQVSWSLPHNELVSQIQSGQLPRLASVIPDKGEFKLHTYPGLGVRKTCFTHALLPSTTINNNVHGERANE